VTPLRASQNRAARGRVQRQVPPHMTAQGQRMVISLGTVRDGLEPTLGRTGASTQRSTPIHESTALNIARAVSDQCDATEVSRGVRTLEPHMPRKRSAAWCPSTGRQWHSDSSMR
jgi:hypothetical protein